MAQDTARLLPLRDDMSINSQSSTHAQAADLSPSTFFPSHSNAQSPFVHAPHSYRAAAQGEMSPSPPSPTTVRDHGSDRDDDTNDSHATINNDLVYALYTFVANLEGQVCVLKGDALHLLDDSNSYWWLIKCIKTDEIGYIPAENIETPFERLARLNKTRNVILTIPMQTDITTPQDSTGGSLDAIKRRPKVTMAEAPTMIVEHDSCDDDAATEDDTSNPDSSDGFDRDSDEWESISSSDSKLPKQRKKSFLARLLSRSTSSMTSSLASHPTDTPSKELLAATPYASKLAEEAASPITYDNDIHVLRIYAGNANLKATFKTVAIKHGMLVRDVVEEALKKFRISSANPDEYYIGVLFGDSQEKVLNSDQSFYDHVDSLRHRHLPGVADFSKLSRHVSKGGQVFSVRVNDDTNLKVLLNRRFGDEDQHLIRVFFSEFSARTEKIRYYKTISVTKATTASEIASISLRKFNILDTLSTYRYKICSVIRGAEQLLDDDINIYEILAKADSEGKDVTFVLTRELLEGATPLPPGVVSATADTEPYGSLTTGADVETLLTSKPRFLESPSMSGSSSLNNLSATPSMESVTSATQGDGWSKKSAPLSSLSVNAGCNNCDNDTLASSPSTSPRNESASATSEAIDMKNSTKSLFDPLPRTFSTKHNSNSTIAPSPLSVGHVIASNSSSTISSSVASPAISLSTSKGIPSPSKDIYPAEYLLLPSRMSPVQSRADSSRLLRNSSNSSTITSPSSFASINGVSSIPSTSSAPPVLELPNFSPISVDKFSSTMQQYDIMEQYLNEILKETSDTTRLEELESKLKHHIDIKLNTNIPPMSNAKRNSLRQEVLRRLSSSGSSPTNGTGETVTKGNALLKEVYADWEAYLSSVPSTPTTPSKTNDASPVQNTYSPITPMTDYSSSESKFSPISDVERGDSRNGSPRRSASREGDKIFGADLEELLTSALSTSI
ncbi:hypothetical protein SeMB42_g04715 [Synchytrium endobioticum]|uniref:SH3 domain-containing protein n=1 Tax=Synchytrium endobioticum TaxID=286115 RepID=A0A507CWF0_9FUNG|nr:hypothetical protein SeMB42_g04715 [Synchytrium endobioticum]